MKTVNLAKALTNNKNCWGFIYPKNDHNYEYQNDNDLGLDLEALDWPVPYIKKIFIKNRYYVYLLAEGDNEEGGVPLETAKALLHECHEHVVPLDAEERRLCQEYWSQFLYKDYINNPSDY